MTGAETGARRTAPEAGWLAPLSRPALAARLAAALDRGSILVIAPAGCGKTLAVEEALALRGEAAAWVRCSEADRDPGRLLENLVRTVRRAVPGPADVVADRLASATERVDVQLAVRELISELERLLVEPLAVVFDDGEHLAAEREAAQLVGDLLSARASSVRVAVCSRRPLPLPTAKLRAAGLLAEFGPADLAFAIDECAELLRRRRGDVPSSEAVEAVWAATEGWPLGVALAAVSPDAPEAAAEVMHPLDRYVDEEVLDSLEPPLRAALVESSVVDELDGAMVRALGLPQDLPQALSRLGVPVRWLRGPGEHFAHHPLIRGLLAARLEREWPAARVRELHAAAAEALEAAGRGPEAVEHWLAAGSPARSAHAVSQYGQQLANTAPATVAGWLEQLPAAAREAPALQLLMGRLAAGEGRLWEADAPLSRAVAGYEARGDVQEAWLARLALIDVRVIREDFAAALPLADGWRSAGAGAAPMVAAAAAAALAGVGRYGDAAELFEEVAGRPDMAPLASFLRGFEGFWVDLQCGRLDEALGRVRQAAEELERADPFDRLPYLLGMAAIIEDERGEEQAALVSMKRARDTAERMGVGGYLRDLASRFAAGIHARAGRLEEAERELTLAAGSGVGWYAGDHEITRATIAARQGRHAAACDAARRALDSGGLHPWRSRWRNTALLAPVLVEAGRGAWARELVDDAVAARPPLASCARLLGLRAWLHSLEGDHERALADLALAWAEAQGAPGHLVRRERPRLEPLLWTAVERGTLPPREVAAALQAAVPGGEALLRFTEHPSPEMRRAAIVDAVAGGHPDAGARLAALESDPEPGVAAASRACRARLRREPVPLVFALLGGFACRRGTFVLDDSAWQRRLAKRLVRFLLVHRDMAVPEDALFEAFWPESPPGAARRSLQVAVSGARAALDTAHTDRSVLVVCERTYRLELGERDVVDVDVFERAASAALEEHGPERGRLLAAAAARWGGEPLPEERYESWATAWRERLIDLQARVLGELAEVRLDEGDHAGAVDAGRRHVELDPLDEAAHRRLMVAYARGGRRGHALRQHLACRRALVETLGVEPAQETRALQRRILAGEPV